MLSLFSKENYKSIVKKCGFSQKEIAEILTNKYNIKTSENGVKNWTRNSKNRLGKTYQPELETIKALADMCNCSIQDFFSDAEKKREQIANEEIKSKPQKYSNSFLSTLPKETKELLENFSLLTQDEQKDVVDYIKQLIHKGKPSI